MNIKRSQSNLDPETICKLHRIRQTEIRNTVPQQIRRKLSGYK